MTALSKLLLGGGALALTAVSAPALAQYYPGYGGYGANGYGYPYGGNAGQVMNNDESDGYGYVPNNQAIVNQCASAAQARLGGNGPYAGYGAGRVLGISQVIPRGDGGITVRGVATSGRYGYATRGPDLTWRCRADARGYIHDVTINPAQSTYGYNYNYTPWDNDYSQYGYRRY